MELDVETDDEEDAELHRPLVRNPILFDADDTPTLSPAKPMSAMPLAAQAARDRDAEDMWAALG